MNLDNILNVFQKIAITAPNCNDYHNEIKKLPSDIQEMILQNDSKSFKESLSTDSFYNASERAVVRNKAINYISIM